MIKPYYQDEWVTIYHGDCREILPELPKVDLVLTDPPYNIHKANWDRIPDYLDWCSLWLKLVENSLADNGSFYFFHNDMPTIAELMHWIKTNTKFVFKQFIVWNKRFQGSDRQYYFDNVVKCGADRNYRQMTEYILFYTFQGDILLSPFAFKLKTARLKKGISIKEVAEYGKFYGNINHGGTVTNWENGYNVPSAKQWEILCDKLPIERKDYSELLQEYEKLRYTYNNQKTHHSVWDYEVADKIDHDTPKPVDLLENIIKHSSNEGYLVLDLFAGSGSTLVASKKLNRKCIGIEIEEKYCEIAAKRCSQSVMRLEV